LWNVYGECKNYNVLNGHRNAVLQVKWNSASNIISCSADKTVAIWDTNKGTRTRKLTDHTAIVNSCAFAKDNTHIIASGSDDCTVILWDTRAKQQIASFYHDYQICSVCLSADGTYVYSGGIDNIIRLPYVFFTIPILT
jgi:Prp8 binding protein